VRFQDWLWGAEQAFQEEVYRSGGPVLLAGFSMGALLSLVLAARRSAQTRALALLGPAARLQGRDLWLLRRLRRWPRLFSHRPFLPKGQPDLEDARARALSPPFNWVAPASLRELFLLQDVAEVVAPEVRAPTLLVLAANDHVVDRAAAERLYQTIPSMGVCVTLPRGFHGMARDHSASQLGDIVANFFLQHV
jgi:pimeloyl-ACP methyl ester carboxylesterase